MNQEYFVRLQTYLQENFPHLRRIWGREKWESFIFAMALVASEAMREADHREDHLPDFKMVDQILFKGMIFSPLQQVQSVILNQFPRFDQQLAKQDPVVRLNILIDIIIDCKTLFGLQSELNEILPANEDDLSLKIAKYLHKYLVIAVASDCV